MKTLKTIQTISKVCKILSKIALIFCIIGFCFCLVGLALTFVTSVADAILTNVDIESWLDAKSISLGAIQGVLAGSAVICFGDILVANQAYRYFTDELAAGTPFTPDGAQKLLRFGIFSIVAPIVATIVASILDAIICFVTVSDSQLKIENSFPIIVGVMLIVMSLLCRLGAESLGAGKN